MAYDNSFEQLAIGIDVGGTGTKFGVVDSHGNILFSDKISTRDFPDVEDFIAEIHDKLIGYLIKTSAIGRVKGVGVGVPNGNYYTGMVEYAANLPWTGIVPLAKFFNDKFRLPITITNDANAAAIGEMMYGAAKGMKDFIMITLGTGVGSGFVTNGELIYGHDGFAGELGHTIIIPDGRTHGGTGIKGPLEAYASATGVALTAVEILQNTDRVSILRETPLDDITSKTVYEAAIKGDDVALEVFEFTGKLLGIALANAIMITSPEAIILFGGLIKAGDLIIKPTKEHMEANLLKVFNNKVKLLISHLAESDAAILGASALVWGKN